MKKGKWIGKIFGVAIVFVIIMGIFGGPLILMSQVEASSEIIYVPDDYSTIQAAVNASSSGDTIIVRDGTYIENVDINRDHLTIESENGAEATTIQAENPDDGVLEVTEDYVEIRGFTVEGATGQGPGKGAGIYLENVEQCRIVSNIVNDNVYGISLSHSSHNNIENNTAISNSFDGILVGASSTNVLTDNICSQNGHGITLDFSTDNILTGNSMSSNLENFSIFGHSLATFVQNIDVSNVIEGHPMYYLVNETGRTIDSSTNAGYVAVIDSTDIVVTDLTLVDENSDGVLFAYTSNSRIENLTVSDNAYGIRLVNSSNNQVNDNHISDNHESGIALHYSCADNEITNNAILNSPRGIYAFSCANNTIIRNDVTDNCWGIYLEESASDNRVYLNNFINNDCGNFHSSSSTNLWNSSGEIIYTYNDNTCTNFLGNYWDDYTGSDADGDGIGETPYSVDSDADNYPLVESFENYVIGEQPSPSCFIATAAYGTPMANEVQTLRDFRDEYLLTNPLGQALVDIYYKVSPPIAESITEHPSLKPIVRAALVPAVVASAMVVNTTPAEKAAILSLLVLISVAVAVWRMRGRDNTYRPHSA